MSAVELEESDPCIEAALEKYPKSWYEHVPLVPLGTMALTGAVAYYQERYLPAGDLLEHLGGLALIASGGYFDHKSTKETFIAKEEAELVGLEPTIRETNPLLEGVTNLDEYEKAKWKKSLLLVESISLILAVIVPPFGYALGAGRYTAAANNRRITKRTKYATELAKSLTPT